MTAFFTIVGAVVNMVLGFAILIWMVQSEVWSTMTPGYAVANTLLIVLFAYNAVTFIFATAALEDAASKLY